MANRFSDNDLAVIEKALTRHPDGLAIQEIQGLLPPLLPRRTLQYRLKSLVEQKRIIKLNSGRWARYLPLPSPTFKVPSQPRWQLSEPEQAAWNEGVVIPLSSEGEAIRDYVRQSLAGREPVGYRREFLDTYRPNISFYLTEADRARMRQAGTQPIADQPAGTYARQILARLLIDLSWNSSRLEGNTYSLLDTRRLIEFGQEADGRARVEAQMILNHKDAIEFLVEEADLIGFNRHTLLNLHAMLADDLLENDMAAGRLRRIAVGIGHSVFRPLDVPQLIEDAFERILTTAAAIEDPFEQAFFAMVQLPYLQPFEDVNKRVSRLAANIPLIKGNLAPLSFLDVPRQIYIEAMLGVYEMNRVELLKDVFLWAYERSAERYAAVRQMIGDPDPFRVHYRALLREVVSGLIRARVRRSEAIDRIAAFADGKVGPADRTRFAELVESELLNLHEGNFARYRISPSEFSAWQAAWNASPYEHKF